MVFGVWCLVFGVWCLVFGVWGLKFGVLGLSFGVWGFGFGFWGSRCRVWIQNQGCGARVPMQPPPAEIPPEVKAAAHVPPGGRPGPPHYRERGSGPPRNPTGPPRKMRRRTRAVRAGGRRACLVQGSGFRTQTFVVKDQSSAKHPAAEERQSSSERIEEASSSECDTRSRLEKATQGHTCRLQSATFRYEFVSGLPGDGHTGSCLTECIL